MEICLRRFYGSLGAMLAAKFKHKSARDEELRSGRGAPDVRCSLLITVFLLEHEIREFGGKKTKERRKIGKKSFLKGENV